MSRRYYTPLPMLYEMRLGDFLEEAAAAAIEAKAEARDARRASAKHSS